VALSLERDNQNAMGLTEYLVINATARITEGSASELRQHLAHTYLGPDAVFPPGAENAPPGFITRMTVDRIGGVEPWTSGA
jgi:hypothetical protein